MRRSNSAGVMARDAVKVEDFKIDYDAQEADFDEECSSFMKKFVDDIFMPDADITQEDKSTFGLLCQHLEGRSWFARHVSSMRVFVKEVSELSFFRLVQYFAIALFECYSADEFKTATTLLNMSFTFYHMSTFTTVKSHKPIKEYLCSYLKDQPIWQSLRFWNSAFLIAVDSERRLRSDRKRWSILSDDEKEEISRCDENSAFGHLGSFMHMMKALDIDKKSRNEFLHKMSVIENLSDGQVRYLEESIEFLHL